MSQEEFDTLLAMVKDRGFRDLLITTWDTGCRPQESLRVEARHVDVQHSRWVFRTGEGKKTGTTRVVYLTERALEITQRLMLQHPQGKLFRNSRGTPWTTDAVNNAFTRVQIEMGKSEMQARGIEIDDNEVESVMAEVDPMKTEKGERVTRKAWELRREARRRITTRIATSLAPKYSLYLLRHSWATHALRRGVDSLTVAILLGHQDPSTLARVYQHLSLDPGHLLAQLKRVAG